MDAKKNPDLVPLNVGDTVSSAYQLLQLPPGSIVLGSDGLAWQSFETEIGNRFRATDGIAATLTALRVFSRRKPLRVLYICEDPKTAAPLFPRGNKNG